MTLVFPVTLVVLVALALLAVAGGWINASADRREKVGEQP